jgi:hypothetical protein
MNEGLYDITYSSTVDVCLPPANYEQPTPSLRLRGGVLEQQWVIVKYNPFPVSTYEWRKVPEVTE